jgi:hypothetical protein
MRSVAIEAFDRKIQEIMGLLPSRPGCARPRRADERSLRLGVVAGIGTSGQAWLRNLHLDAVVNVLAFGRRHLK